MAQVVEHWPSKHKAKFNPHYHQKKTKHFFFLVLLGVKPKASHLLPSIYQLHLSLQQSNFLFK
jgi:hypothetical protein